MTTRFLRTLLVTSFITALLAACSAPPPRTRPILQPSPPLNLLKVPLLNAPIQLPKLNLIAGGREPGEPESEATGAEAHGKQGEAIERQEFYRLMRTYPANSIPPQAHKQARELYQRQLTAQQAVRANAPNAGEADLVWEGIGPAPIHDAFGGSGVRLAYSGRATAILVHPQNPNIIYVGTGLGGVWKSTNGGESYVPLTDHQPSLAVGTMTFDPNDPNTIYVGTGQPAGGDSFYGAGILKSTDGGATWTVIGQEIFAGLGIADIVVLRNSPNTLLVAAGAQQSNYTKKPLQQPPGIYKTSDGGITWTRVVESCNDQGCVSPSALVVDPTDPNIVYVGADGLGVVKSTDGGATGGVILAPENTQMGHVEVAISPSNGNVLYAGLEIYQQENCDGENFLILRHVQLIPKACPSGHWA